MCKTQNYMGGYMKLNNKKTITILMITTLVGIAGSTFAKTTHTNTAEMTAEITNQSVESVLEQKKNENKTFGQIAKEAGKLEEFKQKKMEMKKAKLDKLVEEGKITLEEAEEKLEKSKIKMDRCESKGNVK